MSAAVPQESERPAPTAAEIFAGVDMSPISSTTRWTVQWPAIGASSLRRLGVVPVALVIAIMAVACAPTRAPSGPSSTPSLVTGVSYLVVIVSAEGSSDGATVTMSGVDPSVLMFADAPARDVASVPMAKFVADWSSNFATKKPNAVLSWSENGSSALIVVELSQPTWSSDRLVWPYTILPDESSFGRISLASDRPVILPTSMQDVRLFIDGTCEPEIAIQGGCAFLPG